MALIIREEASPARLEAHLALDALARLLTPGVLAEVLEECHVRDRRVRKLPAPVMLAFCIALNLFAHESQGAAFRRLVHGLRWLVPDPRALRVTKGALTQARARLGARPVVALFQRVCRPLATPATPGAFVGGLRHLALDSQTFDLPDTPANARAYGRPANQRGTGAWPQAVVVALAECGTHAYLDAGLWPAHADQHAAARRLLRSAGPGDLLSYDAGLHSIALLAAARARRAHVLAPLPAGVRPRVIRPLPDGSALVRLMPTHGPRRRERALLVRLIRYTLNDPALPHHGAERRLITTLLNPRRFPAADLVVAYHGRWEYELAADEVETHQRPRTPLRSQRPVGVVQEVYGLLLAHYLVRSLMAEAAQAAALAPTRLSFLESLRLIRDYLPDFQRAAPVEHPRLRQALLADLRATQLPVRANRTNPRVVKQKVSPFPVKRPHHRPWPPPTKSLPEAIVLLI